MLNSSSPSASLDKRAYSGARVTEEGLHLGHLNGCFLPRATPVSATRFVFAAITSKPGPQVPMAILQAKVCAKHWEPSYVVLEEELLSLAPNKYSLLQKTISAWHLIQAYPRFRSVFAAEPKHETVEQMSPEQSHVNVATGKQGPQTPSAYDLLFPVRQAAAIWITSSNAVFMNDDNNSYVKFARKAISRTLDSGADYDLTLIPGPYTRLPGFDGERMARLNRNALFLNDSRDRCFQYAKKAVTWSCSPRLPRVHLPDTYPPFCFARAFGGHELEGFPAALREHRVSLEDAIEIIGELLWRTIEPVQIATRALLEDQGGDVRQMLTTDLVTLREEVTSAT